VSTVLSGHCSVRSHLGTFRIVELKINKKNC
jgi:hypothetical protein